MKSHNNERKDWLWIGDQRTLFLFGLLFMAATNGCSGDTPEARIPKDPTGGESERIRSSREGTGMLRRGETQATGLKLKVPRPPHGLTLQPPPGIRNRTPNEPVVSATQDHHQALESVESPADFVPLSTLNAIQDYGLTHQSPGGEPLAVVIGADDNEEIGTTTGIPWRWVAKLEMRWGSEWYRCSGAMVGSHWLLTAGHCVYDHDFNDWADQINVIPGKDGSNEPYGSTYAKKMYSLKGWTQNYNYDYDIALLELADGIGNQVGWFGVASKSDSNLIDSKVNMAGYPGAYGNSLQYFNSGYVTGLQTNRIHHTCDTHGGQSGSPVWHYDGENRHVVGVHSGGYKDNYSYNRATRVTKAKFDWIAGHLGVCIPDCNGQDCGGDGCGGSCGSCGTGLFCSSGQCVCDDDCSAGSSKCLSSGTFKTCGDFDADWCLEWSSSKSCPSGTICDGGQCVCQDDCTYGEATCLSDTTYKTCGDLDSDSCYEWSSSQSCGSGEICLNGKCHCQDECKAGDSTCSSSDSVTFCGDFDADDCLEWGTETKCPAGGVCQYGQCMCVPQCADRQCGDDGCGGTCGTCSADSQCAGGTCLIVDGARCEQNQECRSRWCVPLVGTEDGYCRSGCSVSLGDCVWGTSCISYGDPEIGVCMPNINKHAWFEECQSGSQCVSGMCFAPDTQEIQRCVFNCIGGTCPDGHTCLDGGYLGSVCWPSAQSDEPQPPTTTITIPYDSTDSRGGCAITRVTGGKAATAPMLLVIALFLLPFSIRRIAGTAR